MNVKSDMIKSAKSAIVYVRKVDVSDLPQDVQEQLNDAGTAYSVHTANGESLALVSDRDLAFRLAKDHGFSPVSVH